MQLPVVYAVCWLIWLGRPETELAIPRISALGKAFSTSGIFLQQHASLAGLLHEVTPTNYARAEMLCASSRGTSNFQMGGGEGGGGMAWE